MLGSFAGANVSLMLDAELVRYMTSYIMLLSAVLLYLKVYQSDWLNSLFHFPDHLLEGKKLYIYGMLAGTVNGFISGAFGIGAAARLSAIRRAFHDVRPHATPRQYRLRRLLQSR